jgi:hypothetical protein
MLGWTDRRMRLGRCREELGAKMGGWKVRWGVGGMREVVGEKEGWRQMYIRGIRG